MRSRIILLLFFAASVPLFAKIGNAKSKNDNNRGHCQKQDDHYQVHVFTVRVLSVSGHL